MSDSTKSLPTEVWLNIFNQLKDGKQLAQCRLVCRSWRSPVDKIMYKVVNLTGMNKTHLTELRKRLAMRPDLGHLVQKICIVGVLDMWPRMYKILQLTPNLKVIDGQWSDILAKKILPKPECSALKLEQLPCIKEHTELCLQSMLRFKDTLRLAAFEFNDYTRYDYRALGKSLNQLRHLQQLTIEDEFAFTSLRDLDDLIMDCDQIQHVQLDICQYQEYIHTDKVELEQWLASGVQRVETVKTLTIRFKDDSLEDEERQPHEFGPDWLYYLVYKYPNLTRLEVYSDEYNRQHLILPKSTHMDTFDLEDWKFYDMDVLKQFIDMLATQSVYIKCKVNYTIHYGDPYICLMSAEKEVPTDYTTFSFKLPCDDRIQANTISVMSLFSSRLIKKFEINLYENEDLSPICASMKCSLNVESFKITTNNQLLTEYPEQPIFAVLHRLEIVDTSFKSDFMTQLNKYAPNLTHLKLDNCNFEDKVSMPSIQLASLSLQKTNKKKDMIHLENRSCTGLLFRISVHKCPEQMFLALPQKPLQRVTKEEAEFLKANTISIECGSLGHLSVDFEDIQFEMDFDDTDIFIERADSDLEDSYYATLERKIKALEEDQKKMETRIKLAEDKYFKPKKYLNDLKIKAIEDSVSPSNRSKCCYNLRNA